MIYLIDDRPFVSRLIQDEIRRAGRKFMLIASPNEAYFHLLEAPAEPDDIVLIDMMMPSGLMIPGLPDFAEFGEFRAGRHLAEALLNADLARFAGRLAIYSEISRPDQDTEEWLDANGIPFFNKFDTMDEIGEVIEEMIAALDPSADDQRR